jgi:hypothetical protein
MPIFACKLPLSTPEGPEPHTPSPNVGAIGYSLGGGLSWAARADGLQAYHMGSQLLRFWPPSGVGRPPRVWPSPGADTFA